MSGYEGEGTGVQQDGPGGGGPDPDMAAGSGWGGSVDGPGGGGFGANNLAKSSQQLADAGVAVHGVNPVNADQTEAQMGQAKAAGNFIGAVAPMAMSAVAPGFGMIMGAAKTANNVINNGMPIGEAIGQYAGGFINGQINKATGGMYGQAQMAGNLAKSLGADVPSMNIGKGIVGSLGMGSSGKSYGGAQQAQSAQSASDYVGQGVDTEGWAKRTGETT